MLGFILFIVKGSSPSVPEIVSLAHSPKSYLIYFRSNTYFVSHSLFSRVGLFYYPRLFPSVIYTHSQNSKDSSCCIVFSMQSFFHSQSISLKSNIPYMFTFKKLLLFYIPMMRNTNIVITGFMPFICKNISSVL